MRFIETIQINNGRIMNLELHKERAQETILYHFGINKVLQFESLIAGIHGQLAGIYKLRVAYGKDIEDFTIEPYIRREVKMIKPVSVENIDYKYKYEDRSELEALLLKKGDCDDIMIIKKGFITDTSFTNIIFSDGDKFFTPRTYLLNGIKRRRMLGDGLVIEKDIRAEDILQYRECFLINSFLDGHKVEICTEG
jgi:4-amino-4-deoxychorismate lyase